MYIQIKKINKNLEETKLIKLRIGREEIVYSDDDLSTMTRNQLKQLKLLPCYTVNLVSTV